MFCGAGAATLQILGAPSERSQQAMVQTDSTTTVSELTAAVPTAPAMAPVAATADIAATEEVTPAIAPAPAIAAEQTPVGSDAALIVTAAAALPAPALNIANEAPAATPPAPPPARKRQLRIVRDSRQCPTPNCSKWTVIAQRAKRPRTATVDVANLHLAPSLRQAAEKGEVELIINAIERHETLKGRDIVIFVATSLTGVVPHDEASRPELLPLPVPGS